MLGSFVKTPLVTLIQLRELHYSNSPYMYIIYNNITKEQNCHGVAVANPYYTFWCNRNIYSDSYIKVSTMSPAFFIDQLHMNTWILDSYYLLCQWWILNEGTETINLARNVMCNILVLFLVFWMSTTFVSQSPWLVTMLCVCWDHSA